MCILYRLAESRRKKVQELEKKITELRRKVSDQDRIVKTKEKQDQQIKSLSNEMQLLKRTRVKLIRQMRIDSDKFTKWKESKEKELNRLKDQNRKQTNEVTRLKTWYTKQETVFKRKMGEAFAVNKRLRVTYFKIDTIFIVASLNCFCSIRKHLMCKSKQ